MSTPPLHRVLTGQEYNIGYALALGDAASIARAVAEKIDLREAIFSTFLNQIDQECSLLCQVGEKQSLFRSIFVSAITQFKWVQIIDELKKKAPLLSAIVSKICCSSDRRNKRKIGSAHSPGICMAIAVLLRKETCTCQLTVLVFAWQLRFY